MVFIILIDHLKGSDITNFSFSRCSNTDIYSWGSIFHGWFVMRVVHCGNYKTAAGPNLSNCSVHCIFNIFLTSFLSRESDDFIWTWHDGRRYLKNTSWTKEDWEIVSLVWGKSQVLKILYQFFSPSFKAFEDDWNYILSFLSSLDWKRKKNRVKIDKRGWEKGNSFVKGFFCLLQNAVLSEDENWWNFLSSKIAVGRF